MHLLKLQKAYKEAEEGPAKEEALKVLYVALSSHVFLSFCSVHSVLLTC